MEWGLGSLVGSLVGLGEQGGYLGVGLRVAGTWSACRCRYGFLGGGCPDLDGFGRGMGSRRALARRNDIGHAAGSWTRVDVTLGKRMDLLVPGSRLPVRSVVKRSSRLGESRSAFLGWRPRLDNARLYTGCRRGPSAMRLRDGFTSDVEYIPCFLVCLTHSFHILWATSNIAYTPGLQWYSVL